MPPLQVTSPKKFEHFNYRGFSVGILSAPRVRRDASRHPSVRWVFSGRIYRPDEVRPMEENKLPFYSDEGTEFNEPEGAIEAAIQAARSLIDSGQAERDLQGS